MLGPSMFPSFSHHRTLSVPPTITIHATTTTSQRISWRMRAKTDGYGGKGSPWNNQHPSTLFCNPRREHSLVTCYFYLCIFICIFPLFSRQCPSMCFPSIFAVNSFNFFFISIRQTYSQFCHHYSFNIFSKH